MEFSEKLGSYLDELNCSISELAKASGLSEATISRYHNGNRTPNNPSEQLDKLIMGLSTLYEEKGLSSKNQEILRSEINEIIKIYDIDLLINNFNTLVSALNINISDFSKKLGFDPSYLSKIRSGKRKPSNPDMLIDTICNYVDKNYNNDEHIKIISELINCDVSDLTVTSSNNNLKEKLALWLCSSYKELKSSSSINAFLEQLNDFNLSTYIKAIKFDELKVPSIPFKIPKSKNYYGIEEMKLGELDFMKSVVLSKNSKSVFMCSDMQMDDMAKDLDFGKKWMFGIAMMIKKGLKLNVVHNIDRPFNEMMLGLESWIPIYMTGQVSPYYLPTSNNSIYSHLNYVSENVCLTGECVKGYHDKGKYYLSENKNDVEYAKSKENLILKKAKPLMEIYNEDEKKLFNDFLETDFLSDGDRKVINSSLPIYTISDDLLLKILKRNNTPERKQKAIQSFIKKRRAVVEKILEKNSVTEIFALLSKEEFEGYPVSLELSELFYGKDITYTYEEYLEHYNQTLAYSKNKNYITEINNNMAFRNIQITINSNSWVMISKNNNPIIHFIIEHPKLCKAIENFDVPITEKF